MPKISIIVPIYNVEKYLKQCLDSILSQSFQDFEIICINDKSPDNSLEILKEYAAKDNRIKIINNKKNVGCGVSRNKGIKRAKGKYIMFIDSDDWYEPDALELLYNQIEKNKNDFVIFDYRKYFVGDSSFKSPTKYMSGYLDEVDNPDIKLWKLQKPFMFSAYVWTQIYNTEFIKKNNIKFDSWLMSEDARFYFGAIISSKSVSIIDKPLINYRIHNESATNSKFNLLGAHIYARIKTYKMFLKSKHKKEYLKSYIPYCIRSVLFVYKKLNKCDTTLKKKYYNKMRSFYTHLNKKYNIEQYKDEINYDAFLDIIENSFYKKYHIDYVIPNILRIHWSKKGKIIIKFLFIKITF